MSNVDLLMDLNDITNNSIREIQDINNAKRLKAHIITHGCQMNEHDSEKISWLIEKMGFTESLQKEEADLIILNTCSIRHSAEDKVYGQLGQLKHLKRANPNLKIAVCGCMMQRKESREFVLDKFKHVDIIFGTNNIWKLPHLLNKSLSGEKLVMDIDEDYTDFDNQLNANHLYDYKAFVNIMYGCNNFCTYCIVPYTRGREVSRDPQDIINEVKLLVSKGVKEVTLLGQNVNSYGKTLEVPITFAKLIKEIDKIEGLERIRFMTSHPKDISDELIACYGKIDKLCNFLHLPVQSGSTDVLKRMNRKYTREQYLDIIKKVKQVNPNIALSTDLIIGFPGETEEDFLDTLELVKEVEYDSAFTFLYSLREGTAAAKFQDMIPDNVKHDRFQRLLDVLYPIQLEKNKKFENQVVKVLVEDISKNKEDYLSGRSEEFKLVHFKGDSNLIGKIVNVKIKSVNTFALEGELVND